MKISARLVVAALVFAGSGGPVARADGRVPGEIETLTDEARKTAQGHLDAIVKGEGDVTKPRRALLVMGPAVWPVVENASRLVPPEQARPHLNYLKALLAPKTEPELEAFRARLRRIVLSGSLDSLPREANELRLGKPDPKKPGKRIPPTIQTVKYGNGVAFRSADGSLVIAYGADADDKKPDCEDLNVNEGAAGFVAAIGGRPMPYARTSGHGCNVNVNAPMGFAFAWSTDGAAGMAPGGAGGEGGVATAAGGAGQHARSGNGGAGAPGDGASPGMK